MSFDSFLLPGDPALGGRESIFLTSIVYVRGFHGRRLP